MSRKNNRPDKTEVPAQETAESNTSRGRLLLVAVAVVFLVLIGVNLLRSHCG